MRVTRAHLGGWQSFQFIADGVAVSAETGRSLLVDGELQPLVGDHAAVPPETGPFELADFGAGMLRLSWAAGACLVEGSNPFSYSGQRFIAWVAKSVLSVVDVEQSLVLRLDVPGLFDGSWSYRSFRSHVGSLWVETADRTLVEIPYRELERLFEHSSGPVEIEVRETYPFRERDRSSLAQVVSFTRETMSVMSRDPDGHATSAPYTVPRQAGVANGDTVHLHDLLWRDAFRELELQDGTRIALQPMPVPGSTITASASVERAIDPAGGPIVVGEVPTRQADLDRLFGALADEPDDAATREILIDLLEDSGEPYAALLHELVAGETSPLKRRAALGPLDHFISVEEVRGGLWRAGELRASAPPDPLIVDKVVTDQRLGLFHTLRIVAGELAIYAKLVGSPRAVGLRHVDVPNAHVLAALIAGKRTQLTALSNVKFATRAVIEGLADPTFDRVSIFRPKPRRRSWRSNCSSSSATKPVSSSARPAISF